MIPLLFLATSWFTETQGVSVEGNVKFYDPGLMPSVAVNRGYIDDVSQYDDWLGTEGIDGGASLLRRGDLGRKFIVIWPDGSITYHISIDCANQGHYDRRVELGDIAEVDFTVAQEMHMDGPVKAKVVFLDQLELMLRSGPLAAR